MRDDIEAIETLGRIVAVVLVGGGILLARLLC